jgi:hypothetical protein
VTRRSMLEAVWYSVGPPPCEKLKCHNVPRCAKEQLACRQFLKYVGFKRVGPQNTEPTAEFYAEVFSGKDDEAAQATARRVRDERRMREES